MEQFHGDEAFLEAMISGVHQLIAQPQAKRILEIGCGTGHLSMALAKHKCMQELLVTDGSPYFLELVRDNLPPLPGVAYGVLDADQLHLLPDGYFTTVAFRYLLHHILDWKGFLGQAVKKLAPGGVLVFEEPCVEGFLNQILAVSSTMAEGLVKGGNWNWQFLRRRQHTEKVACKQDYQNFMDTILFYLKTRVDKTASEDKHLFQTDEIFTYMNSLGLIGEFFPNQGFNTMAHGTPPNTFIQEFRHNLAVNFGFGEKVLEIFDRRIAPNLEFINEITDNAPRIKGTFRFIKQEH